MRFHLIDKLLIVKKWERCIAIKNVTTGMPYFLDDNGMFSSPLILEGIFQAAAWLIVDSSEQKYRPAIVSFEGFDIYEAILPGNQLRIEVEISDVSETFLTINGQVYMKDKLIAKLKSAILQLLDTSELENKEETSRYLKLLIVNKI